MYGAPFTGAVGIATGKSTSTGLQKSASIKQWYRLRLAGCTQVQPSYEAEFRTSATKHMAYRRVFGSHYFLDDGECLAIQRYRVGHVERPRETRGQELGIVFGHLGQAAGVSCNLDRFRATHAHRKL